MPAFLDAQRRPPRIRLLPAVLVLAVVGSGATAVAQPRNLPGQPLGELSPAEIQRLFDAYVLVQAQDMLQLDDSKYGQFATRLKHLQETRRANQAARQRLLQDLMRLSNPSGPAVEDRVLEGRLRDLEAHDRQAAEALRDAYARMDEVLTVRQRARFRAFEEQMERRKLELLMRARQQNRNTPRRER